MRLLPVPAGARAVFPQSILHSNRVDRQQIHRAAMKLASAHEKFHEPINLMEKIKRVKNETVNFRSAEYTKLTVKKDAANNLIKELKSLKPYSIKEHVLGFFGYGRKADIQDLTKIVKRCDHEIKTNHFEKNSYANDVNSAIRNRVRVGVSARIG